MSDDDTPQVMAFDEMIDINEVLQALDRDLERRLDIARRLEPILRDIVRYYGVPPDNWHSFGIIFRFDNQDSGKVGLEVGGMALRASGTRGRHPDAAATAHVEAHVPATSGGAPPGSEPGEDG
ncbi:hypothetical protein FHS82_001567 [Pseudochelatococcus lubricantis]|uniref:Uncharacterized protein n=1 Tax=Pseudochelatococcus lubricantis TaxID=1538102 RepID=A0ABX0UXQ9_9HYPH|nr:hypothetical protein [Pseudochelatococcus lubricantis]NIJ57731.1 hypothetical protein [Pseudochelatococcus lubricantis]